MKTLEAMTQSVKARLSKLAREQRKPYDRILTLFLLERAVARMVADGELEKALVFKGGYVGVRVYESPRFTTDVDAVIHGIPQESAIARIKKSLELVHEDATWFRYIEVVHLATQNEYGGTRLVYRAGVGSPPKSIQRAQIVHIDVGIGDPVTPSPSQQQMSSLISDDLISWQVYPPETILSEKLHTLITRGAANSRARDIFDVALLLDRADPTTLLRAMKATFEYRGDILPDDWIHELEKMDTSLLQKGWRSAAGYIAGAGDFDSTYEGMVTALKGMFRDNR